MRFLKVSTEQKLFQFTKKAMRVVTARNKRLKQILQFFTPRAIDKVSPRGASFIKGKF